MSAARDPRAAARRRMLAGLLPEARALAVVDVGANGLHRPPYAALLAQGLCTVTGFEPQAEALARLRAAAGPGERYLPHAVGPAGEAVLHHYPMGGFTSLYRLREGALAYFGRLRRNLREEQQVRVTLHPLDAIADLGPCDLLKIDVQGAERDIFRSGRQVLGETRAVWTELRYFPLYEGEPGFGETDSELRAQGFVLHKLLPVQGISLANSQSHRLATRAMQSQTIDGDAIYIRPPDADTAPEALARLALMADAVFASPDLALRCLDLLAEAGHAPAALARRYVEHLPPHLLAEAATEETGP